MLKQRKSIVGLDIGSSCIKAVELTREKYDRVITGYAQIDVPNEAARQDAIAELMRAAKFRSKRVATAVSGKNVIFRYISMAEMSDDKLLQAVRMEADKYIPFDVSEVELDAQKIGAGVDAAGKPDMKVLLIAAKKSIVADHARILTELGLQPISVGVDGFALGNAWELGDQVNPGIQDPGRTVSLIDIGATKSSINILRDNISCFAREVPMGGQDLTNAIARRLGVEPAQAESDEARSWRTAQHRAGGHEPGARGPRQRDQPVLRLLRESVRWRSAGSVAHRWHGAAAVPRGELREDLREAHQDVESDRRLEGEVGQRRRRGSQHAGTAARGGARPGRCILRSSP
jgi:type IV pilus assembly protein PilM